MQLACLCPPRAPVWNTAQVVASASLCVLMPRCYTAAGVPAGNPQDCKMNAIKCEAN